MIDLYVVESPLQALSAAEAKALNGDNVESVIFVKYGLDTRHVHNDHLERSVIFGMWNKIVPLRFSKYTGLKYHFSLIFFLLALKKKYCGRVRNLYIGEFRSDWMLYLRCVVDPIRSYLLDDGAATLTVQERYLSKRILWPCERSASVFKKIVKRCLYSVVYDERVAQKLIHLFTSFDVPAAPEQEVLKHSFEFARRNIRIIEDRPEVYYFGAKYSEAGIMTERAEIDFLSGVFCYYKKMGFIVVYIPHRDDSFSKVSKIEKMFGVTIKRLGCAAEVYFSVCGYMPLRIAAAYSSVLNSLRFFRGCEACDSFVIPSSMLESPFREAVGDVYDYYRNIGINVIRL